MAYQPLPFRAVAANVLLAVEQGQSLSQCLPPALNQLAPEQRPQLQAICYGTCRWFHRLDDELRQRLKKPLRKPDRVIHHLMLVALFQLRYSEQATYAVLNETVEACRALDKPHLTGLVNGVLRAAEREGAPEPRDDSSRFSHPAWMVEKLRHNWPDHWEAILDANNQQAPMTLRVNALRFTRDDYLNHLQEAGIRARPTRFAPNGIQLESPVPVDRLPWFADGAVSVQDEAAQLCTTLLDLQPGHRVLDACAAPGGKTCAILETCGELAEVVAIDESAERLPRVQENLDRLDLHATLKQADAANIDQWWDGQAFDRILLDVPCSATGVVRRHPDIKLLRRESDIVPLASIQLGLLDAMWAILKPGGRLVYATCSVFPQENHRIIQRFLKQQDQALLLNLDKDWGQDMQTGRQLLPDPDSHDGFFYAVLEKPAP
ncbi:16S rRNA (cytosine(967)-C(5))-methyltransferase RsmB [Marinobacter daepoensis]|uniref:16S rRNA (cytosine(967)-C(5))-methyltransferase n=1 Tax=Marinobacter daepoensis TaxID=262077 RepID=A0ABS3BF17_9GAMM|nr:16S rRNA (cytosine(967)-C(5))-methyltransferase RsmB [Marinobacter daepoensis]MBN7769915.1 16S rRNA (cytosine(967)-C(5))-methyltransferase RsmB [Marinobacter daepoensis]MBY6080303.1 16S rRNA (cytosine(967)-C(5))-methyltransferase RsmB [Marinobacter daepoensis]